MKKIKLSIIIVSYNTKEILKDCLNSLVKVSNELPFEIIVSDNGSTDGSIEMIEKMAKSSESIKLIKNGKNLGFSKGNNIAKKVAKGEYILFLNSDTIVHKNTLKKTVEYMEKNKDVGSMTCKIVLTSGELDKDTRRSFPTPWVAFTHLALPLDRIFPRSRMFAKYWYGYLSPDIEHEVDVIQGAFHLTRRDLLDEVEWFDEDYFLDGEDIDLCWKIKKKGWKIMYVPQTSIIHIKKASKKSPDKRKRIKFASSGSDAMALFYKKRMWSQYPAIVNYSIIFAVNVIKRMRVAKIYLQS